MIQICALASGSNGNCYYVGTQEHAVLVDAGLSARQLQLRMLEKNIDQQKIRAIIVSHEHSDHCRGARVLSKRLGVPVYLTRKTFMAMRPSEHPEKIEWFFPGDCLAIGHFKVHSFLKKHDAVEGCSFRVQYNGLSVGVMTDIGEPCDRVRTHLEQCNAVFLESNYDEHMLQNGSYPWFLKERVGSDKGHLSNRQAALLAEETGAGALQTIFLSHLSGENNTPEKAMESFAHLQARFRVHLTSRHQATDIFEICG